MDPWATNASNCHFNLVTSGQWSYQYRLQCLLRSKTYQLCAQHPVMGNLWTMRCFGRTTMNGWKPKATSYTLNMNLTGNLHGNWQVIWWMWGCIYDLGKSLKFSWILSWALWSSPRLTILPTFLPDGTIVALKKVNEPVWLNTFLVAFRDCTLLNLMMDATPFYPELYHPVKTYMKHDFSGETKHFTWT